MGESCDYLNHDFNINGVIGAALEGGSSFRHARTKPQEMLRFFFVLGKWCCNAARV